MEEYRQGRAKSSAALIGLEPNRPGSPRRRRGDCERRKWKQIAVANRARDRYLKR